MEELTNLSYEVAFQELEALVARMESGDLPLEESVKLYERVSSLRRIVRRCWKTPNSRLSWWTMPSRAYGAGRLWNRQA